MTVYRSGQIWERDGKRREIVAIRTGASGPYHGSTEGLTGYELQWRRDAFDFKSRWTWFTTWRAWAKGAELVEVRK